MERNHGGLVEHPDWRRHLAPVAFVAAGTAVGASAGAVYAASSPTPVEAGPHQATVELNSTGMYKIDFGMIGSITMPSEQGPIGAELDILDVPAEDTTAEPFDYEHLATQYKQLFANPDHVFSRMQENVRNQVEQGASKGAALGLVLAMSGLIAVKSMSTEKQQALRTLLVPEGPHPALRKVVTAGGLAGICALLVAPDIPNASADSPSEPVAAFAGTPFEGATVHGLYLRSIIDEVAPEVIDFIEDTDGFYEQAQANFEEAFNNRPSLDKDEAVRRVMIVSDIHCNIGISRVYGAVARRFAVGAVIDAGDATMSGTPVEEECIANEADALGDTPRFITLGNHDSPQVTGEQARNHNFMVANGEMQEFAGFTVLGASDPRRSRFGAPDIHNNDQRLVEQGKTIKETACVTEPDIVVMHDPKAGQPTAEAHCANLTISGHVHEQAEPEVYQDGLGNANYHFVQGTTGGAKEDSLVLGALNDPAVMSVFEFGDNNKPLGRYDITVNTDSSVKISQFIPLPR